MAIHGTLVCQFPDRKEQRHLYFRGKSTCEKILFGACSEILGDDEEMTCILSITGEFIKDQIRFKFTQKDKL